MLHCEQTNKQGNLRKFPSEEKLFIAPHHETNIHYFITFPKHMSETSLTRDFVLTTAVFYGGKKKKKTLQNFTNLFLLPGSVTCPMHFQPLRFNCHKIKSLKFFIPLKSLLKTKLRYLLQSDIRISPSPQIQRI